MLHVEEARSIGRLLEILSRHEEAGVIAESIRRQLAQKLHSQHLTWEELEQKYGKVWSPDMFGAQFEVKGFLSPFVVVVRKGDGVLGSLAFQHCPRFYFDWMPHEERDSRSLIPKTDEWGATANDRRSLASHGIAWGD